MTDSERAVTADTIFALASGPGRSGVAVFRLSGPAAKLAVETLAGRLPQPRRATVRRIVDPRSGACIDEALIVWMPSPHSFTGEDVAEFHTHGGRAVAAAMLAALGSLPGCRCAEPGEFARRAFEAGRLDLAQVEGLADLIEAETEMQRKLALRQAGGELSRIMATLRERLIGTMALVEAAIDFADEGDVAADATAQAENMARLLREDLLRYLEDNRRGEIVREGYKVVLAGPPNAGKSSLLNRLARRDAAIVSAEPGTTRDTIEIRLDLDGMAVVLTDTAGLREADSEIEREGIRRTIRSIGDADLMIWVAAPDAPGGDADAVIDRAEAVPPSVLHVMNKGDLLPEAGTMDDDRLLVSAQTGAGIDVLVARIAALAADRIGPQDGPVLTHARHRHLIDRASRELDAFLGAGDADLELRAEHLRSAAAALARMTGRLDVEDVLDQVFGRFCIGK
ncbi:MAG: tRNA uridine-5-carboxymethylaminomethyl(34) synthesis GTPase MnmE [Hyphomicrobiaceae bacterium]|nr:tRNA uridine-5-carboxymethylaminomethyl(34) synthesis GTPase MnmE [Hyphomicrobiaceae bacterium]